jgi:nucleoside 2-deoxyribosyltransferase
MKTISICGSMKLCDRMITIGKSLAELGHTVYLPNVTERSDYSTFTEAESITHKSSMIHAHLVKIQKSDCVLVVNETLKDTVGYIGANTFLEMGFAYALGKAIYTLNALPEQPNSLEIKGLLPVVISGELRKI